MERLRILQQTSPDLLNNKMKDFRLRKLTELRDRSERERQRLSTLSKTDGQTDRHCDNVTP